MILTFTLVSLLAQAPAAAVPRSGFVLVHGTDTVSVERFSRTAARLEGELSLRSAGLRVTYDLARGADGAVSHASTSMWRGGRGGAPAQTAEMSFRGDSVYAEVKPGGPQRMACPHGAIPYANPSMAMLEEVVRHARAAGGPSTVVPVFLMGGGRVLQVTVTRIGADSVGVEFAGVEMRLAADATGRILGGRIPAQGIVLTRFEGDAASLAMPPADYSAPPGAPYTAEEVSVPCPGGFALAGTLTRPKDAKGRVPCVVMITGSGLQDRDESIPSVSGYRPFRQFAEAFAKTGMATLRLDDRGFGASGGDPSRATTADFAGDIRAALAWVRSAPGIDAGRLALAGHSEGGCIAPMIAADDAGVHAIVLVAGPAWPGRRIIEYQNRYAISRGTSRPPATVDSMVAAAMVRVDSLAAATPWLRYFLDYDPLPAARRVKCAALVVQGGTDTQVDPSQAPELVSALRSGGNRKVELRELPGLDHLLLPDPSGDPAGYAALPVRRIQPEVLDGIAVWLAAALGR